MNRRRASYALLAAFSTAGAAACGDGSLSSESRSGKDSNEDEFASSVTQAQVVNPAPSDVVIEGDIVTGGNGCPFDDSVSTQISADRRSFLIIFSDMSLENPPGPTVKNMNCVASVKLRVPFGWQYSVATVNTRGYAFLSSGHRARLTSSYFFAGVPLSGSFRSELRGPFDKNYEFTDNLGIESVSWSPCGENHIFAVNTSMNLNTTQAPLSPAVVNTETVDGIFRKVVQWGWRRC